MKTRCLMAWLLCTQVVFASPPPPPVDESSKAFQRTLSILTSYETSRGVTMNVKKRSVLKLLKKEYVSEGKIFLSQGFLALYLEKGARVVLDIKKGVLWYISGLGTGSEQVVRQTGPGKKADLLGWVFSREKLVENFRFVSLRQKGRTHVLEFAPLREGDIKTLSLKVEGRLLLEVRIQWKSLGNEERYEFSDIQFNRKMDRRHFQVPGLKS